MSAHCCPPSPAADPRYRRVLWIALVVNAAMFALEVAGSWRSGSVSLLADAIDFFGDAANYAVSLAVLGLGVATRARTALLKAACMAAFGLFVLAGTGWSALHGAPPESATMGAIGLLALAANVGVAALLFRWRSGDANMRSVWICTRNDALGNVAVLVAAAGVFGTGSAWPDLAVAVVMASLALWGAVAVAAQARRELRGAALHDARHPATLAAHDH